MIALTDGLLSLVSFIVPPLFNFINRKFVPSSDEDSTLSILATTKPEVLAPYIDAYAKLIESKTEYANRDIVGTPSKWLINLRGSIIPICVLIAVPSLCAILFFNMPAPPKIVHLLDVIISGWFGNMILKD